jgi:hypothetical protein
VTPRSPFFMLTSAGNRQLNREPRMGRALQNLCGTCNTVVWIVKKRRRRLRANTGCNSGHRAFVTMRDNYIR